MYNRKIVAQPLEVSRAKIIMKNRRPADAADADDAEWLMK